MNKKGMAAELATKCGITKIDAEVIIDTFCEIMHDKLIEGEKLSFTNLFHLYTEKANPRKARNPQTGEEIMVPARMKLKMKLAKPFKEELKEIDV